MVEDPFLLKEVPEVGDELKEACAQVDDVKASGNFTNSCPHQIPNGLLDSIISQLEDARSGLKERQPRFTNQEAWFTYQLVTAESRNEMFFLTGIFSAFLFSKDAQFIGGQRVVDAIVVSAVILLSFVYLYLVGYIDRGGSKAGSSGSLDFRDIYISILLFQAAFVWIKFRDVISRGAVYHRPGSNKFEPRIKFPVIMKGAGVKSKRVPLGLYNTFVEAKVAYQIAAFYCNKPQHRLGRLGLGGGAYFPIPALSVDPSLPYEEQVNQVKDQVLKVYVEFQECRKASRNLPPTSPVQQLRRQPLNSRMDLAMQDQGSQPAPNIHNRVDFNNPSSAVLAKTQHELLEAHKQIECLKARVSQMEVENMGWEVKYSDLERRFSELVRENGLLNHHIVQPQLPPVDPELDFDPDMFFNMGHEESLAR